MSISLRNIFLILIPGLIWLVVGIFLFRISSPSGYKSASGTIVDIRLMAISSFTPVVEFKTDKGELISFTSGIGSTFYRGRKGESVKVLYSPDNPKKALIDSASERFIFPGSFVVFGFILIWIFIRNVFSLNKL